ncbi:hypothetical protein COMA2_20044 [Candidatus Nitrospira nitrificans]|uniref:Uncharacterized protein n=1 Tax=Candidatus Nitrospira nitrificans TaxID=1742973 RepID=A0A0S4LCW1_9BACT|nr:hypothetical protein COMA2_20044 [Candidatus Nitrospira nitrificans]
MRVIGKQLVRREIVVQDVSGNCPDRDACAGDVGAASADGSIGLDYGCETFGIPLTVPEAGRRGKRSGE